MELEILERNDNPLLEREEINFRIRHPKDASPRRKQVREQLASALNAKASMVVIDNMDADFGRPETVGYAKHYKNQTAMQSIEAPHVLKRNGLYAGKAKAAAGDSGGKKEAGEKQEAGGEE